MALKIIELSGSPIKMATIMGFADKRDSKKEENMDIITAINSRKSIRKFRPDPVPKEVLVNVLESACRAPSAMNTQAWEFIVITGEVLEKIRSELVGNLTSGASMEPDHHVVSWSSDSKYKKRQVELAKSLFKVMDIQREDTEKRTSWLTRGFRFFDAPAGVLLLSDKSLSLEGPLLDIGAAMQNFCLAALKYDLGTCIEDQAVLYPEVIRKHADIPDTKRLIIGIAVGYPDWEFPANGITTTRVPLKNNTTWYGF